MRDGLPDSAWTQKEILVWLAERVNTLKDGQAALTKGLQNHLSHHFKTNLVLLAGIFTLASIVVYMFAVVV